MNSDPVERWLARPQTLLGVPEPQREGCWIAVRLIIENRHDPEKAGRRSDSFHHANRWANDSAHEHGVLGWTWTSGRG